LKGLDNTTYPLGNQTTEASTAPQVPIYYPNLTVLQVAAGDGDAWPLLSDGSVHCWGTIMTSPTFVTWPWDTPVQFPAGTPPIAQITHGEHHACALTEVPPTGGNAYAGLVGSSIGSGRRST
jgi:hypothetical protein